MTTVNARISDRGTYLIFRVESQNSKGGAYLKGALISFFKLQPQYYLVFI